MSPNSSRGGADGNGCCSGTAAASPTDALLHVLYQMQELLGRLTDAQYTTRPVGPMSSSIGGHVRHILDHFTALLDAARSGVLNYDCRERDTPVERDRRAAAARVRELIATMPPFTDESLGRPLHMTVMLAADGCVIEVPTSLGRELAFVQSHTIHHNALIAAMAKLLGVDVPEEFGTAPATIAHQQRAACAPSPLSR